MQVARVIARSPEGSARLSGLSESRLEALLESAQLLHATLHLDDLLKHLLRTVMGRLLVSRGAIAVRRGDRMEIALSRGVRSLAAGELWDEAAAEAAGLAVQFPIGEPENPVGLLAIGNPPRGALESEEHAFLSALLGLAASGIANAQSHEETVRINRKLDQKIQELRAILDLVRGLASTLEPAEVAQMLLLTLAGRWAVRKHGIATWREHQTPVLRQKGLDLTRALERTADIAQMPPSVLLANAEAEDLQLPEGSLLLPLRSGQETFGVVVCGPRGLNQSYSEADLDFGTGLVAQAVVAFENAWLFRESLVKQQMEKEIALAANIQQTLFPASLPRLNGCDLAARNRQARQVGGDYYDAIPAGQPGPAQSHLLCVIDVSGKGLFASLLMSNIQASLRALLSTDLPLTAVAERTNDLLFATTPSNRYATAFLLVFDPQSGACEWVNCGHNDGIVLRADGSVEMLPCSGLALGLFARRTYESQRFTLNDGDVLAIYSDGVTDAQDSVENEFGTERLVEALRVNAALSPCDIVDQVFLAIDAFAGTAPQFDDITIMVVKRGGAIN